MFLFVYAGAIAYRTLRTQADANRRSDTIPYAVAAAGGALTGLISIGIGILAMPSVLRHRTTRKPGEGIGSLVMIIFFTSLAAILGRMRPAFIAHVGEEPPRLIAILIWSVPTVVIGGQNGPRLAQLLPSERHARLYFNACW